MAHAGMTDKTNVPCEDGPDSLQDLCVFYCMNNLDVLVESLNKISDASDDISSLFSLLLGNRMMEYYLRYCLPSIDKEEFVDQLMQNSQLCNEVCITRRDMLNPGNIQELANNSIRKLQLTVFEEDCSAGTEDAYRHLLEKTFSQLTSICLYQKCEDRSLTGLLNILCGRDYEHDAEENSSSEDEGDESQAAGDSIDTFEEVANKKYHGFQIRSLNTPTQTEAGTTCTITSVKPAPKANESPSNLKSFSYEQVYTSIHHDLQPSDSFGWFYNTLSKVLQYNRQLQSFSLVTVISNPVEWFLSQPKLPLLKNLQSLCLSFEFFELAAFSEDIEMTFTKKFFSNLPVLENLRHLDISCSNPGPASSDRYKYDDSMVELFVQAIKKMPQLKSLDISGTNLSTIIGHTDEIVTECMGHCMPGFEGRQFAYLGLYGNEDACRHKFIPADRVSGDASLDQLLVALWSLQHNKEIMKSVLKELQDWTQAHFISAKHGLAMLDGLMAYMTKIGDWDNSFIQDGSNSQTEEKNINLTLHCVYFLLRNDDVKKNITLKHKRQLTEQLFVICHTISLHGAWQSSSQVNRNKILRVAMLLILILDLENVAVYSYRFEQYIQLLLAIFNSSAKQTQKLLALRLLHSACRFSQELKAVAGGKMQLVKKLLMTVMDKVTKGEEVDDIMEKVWSILWTLTDEVPVNCELFVHHAGCQMAKTCIEKYSNVKSLHRKISGAMNNVSENASLAPLLMTKELVVMFRGMLSYYEEEDYDVSSHAAGFLIMLASHGPEAWTVEEPSRDTMLSEVEEVMKKWDITKPKGVKFRSLNPMLTQIENYSTPVAQLWGAWLICNLVIVKPHCYCDMLESENGMMKIDTVLHQEDLQDALVKLLQKIRSLTLDYMDRRARNEPIEDEDDD